MTQSLYRIIVNRKEIVMKIYETLFFHKNRLKINLRHSDVAQNF